MLTTFLELPLYALGCYLAGWLVALPGMMIAKGLEGAYPKWQAHVCLLIAGGLALALFFAPPFNV